MYARTIIVIFLLIVGVITIIQNGKPQEITFLVWNFTMSSAALILYCTLLGAVIVAVLTLPKLVTQYLRLRRLDKKLKEIQGQAPRLQTENPVKT